MAVQQEVPPNIQIVMVEKTYNTSKGVFEPGIAKDNYIVIDTNLMPGAGNIIICYDGSIKDYEPGDKGFVVTHYAARVDDITFKRLGC